MNISDTERICAVLNQMGFSRTNIEEEAQLLGVVACSVRQRAIDRVYAKIAKWNSWKNRRNIITFASGCILPADKKKLLKRFDLLFSIQQLPELPEILSGFGVPTAFSISNYNATYWNITPNYESHFDAYVPIQNGCNKFCSFCAVPYTRGRETSRPSAEIIEEVTQLLDKGYKSITLLGQNVNSYGQDTPDTEISFPELMRNIGELGKKYNDSFWIYFTSPHPKDMTPELLDVIAAYPVLAKQIHLPIQSGDDQVLKTMNRGYSVQHYENIVLDIRRKIPSATIFTDIIVGFSGETNEQFLNTKDALRRFRFNMAYIAIYSPRPGAASSEWPDDIPHEEKKRRLHVLSQELQAINLETNQLLVGQKVKLLVERHDRKSGYLSGRTEGKLIVRFAAPENISTDLIGTFVEIKITKAASMSMEGDLILE